MPASPSLPARLLVTGSAGSGKTHMALERIRAAATVAGDRGRGAAGSDGVAAGAGSDGVAAGAGSGGALLVLPTYAQVLHVKRIALSRWEARGILDAPFSTFTSVGERFIEGFRVRSLPSADERDRLMEAALHQAGVPLFDRIADRVGFRARLLRLVKEVKQGGLATQPATLRLASSLAQLGPAAAARLAGFIEVFRVYEGLLHAAGLDDHEDALRALYVALSDPAALATGRVRDVPSLLVVDGFDDFTPIEERILLALAQVVGGQGGQVVLTLPFDPRRPTLHPGAAEARARWLRTGFVEHALTGFPRSRASGLQALATRLFLPASDADGPPAPLEAPEGVSLLLAGDAEDEAEQIAREVRRMREAAADGLPQALPIRGWRDFGIVVRRTDAVAPRFEAAFARMGVPLRVVGPGHPLASEPLVRALRGPLQLLAGRHEAGQFEARPLTAWIRWRAALERDAQSADAVDEWEVEHRGSGYPRDLVAYAAAMPERLTPFLAELEAARAEMQAVEAGPAAYPALGRAIERLTRLPASPGTDARGYPRDALGDRRLVWARLAKRRLQSILGGLEAAVRRTDLGAAVDAGCAVDELGDAILRTRIALPDRRLDVVNLMDAEEARYWELPVVFVAGLEEGAFPLHPREDVLLRDRDRERLAEGDAPLHLPLSREREERERRLFHGALTRARSHLVLSRSVYDENGDAQGASIFLRDVARVLTPVPCGAAPRPGRVAVEQSLCVSTRDWRRFAAAELGRGDAPERVRVLAASLLAQLGAGVAARAARARRPRIDPIVGPGGQLPDWILARLLDATKVLSVSRLHLALLCPYRFFLRAVVGVPEDDVPFDGPGFDLRREGTALHRALEIALDRPTATPADVAAAVAQREQLDEVERHLLLGELARVVTLFRRREAKLQTALRPDTDSLEHAFGYEQPVFLGEGPGRFALRGKIDRIDADGRRASLIDYKSSATGCTSAAKAALEESDLQLPLYAKAIMQEGKLDVQGLEWIAIRTRQRRAIHSGAAADLFAGRREGVAAKVLAPEAFTALLDQAERTAAASVAWIRSGRLPKAPVQVKGSGAKTCAACPWDAVCRPDPAHPEARPDLPSGALPDAPSDASPDAGKEPA